MHELLAKRVYEFVGCTEGSPEEAKLAALVDAMGRMRPSVFAKVLGGRPCSENYRCR